MNTESKRLEILSFIVLLGGVSLLAFFIFQPFLHILILAGVLTVLFQPLYKKMLTIFNGKGKNFFAFLVVVIALIFLIIPILFFGLQILGQAQSFFSLTQPVQGQHLQALQQSIETLIKHVFPNFSFNISSYISRLTDFISSNLGVLISGTAYIILETMFLLFTFFFFLRDGEKILTSFITFSPFGNEQNKKIINSVSRTITSVIRGTLFVGLIRWIIMALGFYLLGIPNFLLWGTIGAIIGAVPGLGTPFVIVPAVAYLLLNGNIMQAIGMGFLGALIILFIDNMLSAYFFGKGLDAPAIFVLFSILGGIMFFGPLGFIFGPIILSLFISVLDMYKILILKKV